MNHLSLPQHYTLTEDFSVHVPKLRFGWPASGFYPEAAYSPTPRTLPYERREEEIFNMDP